MNLLTHIYDIDKKRCLLQCACGKQVTKSISHWKSGKAVSCGCWTKDGRMNLDGVRRDHPLWATWLANHKKTYPDFNLLVAELGQPPYPGATVTTKDDSLPFAPGNVTWDRPIYSHGTDYLHTILEMPLDYHEFGKYNIAAYEQHTEISSHQYLLNRLTKQYDDLRAEYPDDPVGLERAIEALSHDEATAKFLKNEQKSEAGGSAHTSEVWAQFKAQLLPMVCGKMMELHKNAMEGRAGIHHHVVSPLLQKGLISPEEIALITLNVTLDAIGDGKGCKTTLTRLYKDIGQRIDDQCWCKWWSQNYPSEFAYVDKWILHSNSGYHYKLRKAVTWVNMNIQKHPPHAYKRLSSMRDKDGRRVGDEPLIHIGTWAFLALQSVCCWFEKVKMYDPSNPKAHKGEREHKSYYLSLSDEGYKYRHLINLGIQELLFEAQPMACEPLPWCEEYHKLNHGGYLVPQPLNFSKLIHGNRGTQPSPDAIRSLNKLQSVGWKINPFMYHTLAAFLGKDIQIGEKFVCHDAEEYKLQHYPHDIDPKVWLLEPSDPERKKAKAKVARMYSKLKENEQLADNPFRCMKTAAKFLNYERIYFPCYFDNRLRIYYLHTSGLHPQGANYAKSLLLFADPLLVTDENRDAVERDLLVSIANCYGNDKISLDERVEFAREIIPAYKDVVEEPNKLGNLHLWKDLAEPFTFLATIRQYYELFIWKTRTTTDIPNGRDASSSGLQLMSALLRDEKAMTYTNVIPGDKPADLYGEVARHATALMNQDVWMHNQLTQRRLNAEKKCAKNGKELDTSNIFFGLNPDEHINRKTTKRAVMTDSYNASWRSKNEYVSQELMTLEKSLGRKVTLAEKTIVTNAIVTGQEQAFPIAKEIKDFFKTVVVEAIGQQGKDCITWNTPCGSQLFQRYNVKSRKQIATYAMGKGSVKPNADHTVPVDEASPEPIKLTVHYVTPEVHSAQHVTSFSPNLHHSYDAYIAQQTILSCGTDVIQSTHDCFYARAGEVEQTVTAAKESFLKLATSDVLQDLLHANDVTYLTIPIQGEDSLLDNVMSSDYMFA